MGFYQAIGASNTSEIGNKVAFPDALANVGNEAVRASVHNILAYGADIANPLFQGGKNILHTFNPYSMAKNGFLKNTFKAPLSAILHGVKTVKNAGAGIGSGIRNFYRHGIQNNLQNFNNGTIANIPLVGKPAAKVIGHTANTVSGIIGAPLAAYDWTARKIDNGLDYLIEKTLLEGQSVESSRMREGAVSNDGLHIYGDGSATLKA